MSDIIRSVQNPVKQQFRNLDAPLVPEPSLWVIKWRPADGEPGWHFYHERGRIWVDDDREQAQEYARSLTDDTGREHIAVEFCEYRNLRRVA
jgi:hypothetical protein